MAYETLAINLANHPEKIADLKAALTINRDSCPLFNTALSTKHIESAYEAVYNRHENELAPDNIHIS